ncbi:MAG: hypothetical protein R3C58_02690 [Parvularculaceae bacterium]
MMKPDTKHSPERRAYIEKRIRELSPWYHKIDLGDGIVTPGFNFERLWSSTLKVIDAIDYKGKRVLDLASWDGFWAFEAERRGPPPSCRPTFALRVFPTCCSQERFSSQKSSRCAMRRCKTFLTGCALSGWSRHSTSFITSDCFIICATRSCRLRKLGR